MKEVIKIPTFTEKSLVEDYIIEKLINMEQICYIWNNVDTSVLYGIEM